MKRLVFVLAACLPWLAPGCASETWDNPHDPVSPRYRGPCAYAPTEEKAHCVFWEDFRHGLTRWDVDGAVKGQKAPRILGATPDGLFLRYLAIPGCDPASLAGLRIEIPLPAKPLELTVTWQPSDKGVGQLALSLNGPPQELDRKLSKTIPGWFDSTIDLSQTSSKMVWIGLFNTTLGGDTCQDEGVRVGQVAVRIVTP